MRTIRVFVSSPTDVDFERQRIDRVVRLIDAEYAAVVDIETVRWEIAYYRAHQDFAREIPQAADCDIVICVFWARLGTPLPDDAPKMPGGEVYESGTAYELLTSLDAARANGRPDVYVFRKTAAAVERVDRPNDIAEAQSQWKRLQAFLLRWLGDSQDRLTKPVYSFETPDEFEERVADLLRQWIKAHVPEAGERWSVELRGSPFRGLAAFDAKHAEVFCGRDRKVGRAIDELVHAAERGKPFLLIVGPSGAGKSSLMRAGLMPRLTNAGAVAGIDIWRTAVMRPSEGTDPFDALAASLFVQGGADDPGGFGPALPELAARGLTADSLAARFRSDSARAIGDIEAVLEDIAQGERARGGFERPLKARLLLLVDQLEDVFTADMAAQTRSDFARVLFEALEHQRIWIATTLRADVYDRLIAERPFIALKDRGGHYDLAPPGLDELEEIIVKSAQVAGLTYEVDRETGESLDQRLLKDAEGEDILPLLEFTLNQLFEKRENVEGEIRLVFSAYEKIGGLGGVIDQAGESAMEDLSETQKAALPRLVRSLVVPMQLDTATTTAIGDRALTIRSVPAAEILGDRQMEKLVDALVKARVLLATKAKGGATGMVRLAHQRVLECWKRVRNIIEAERTFFRVRDEVEGQWRRWNINGKRQELLVPPGRPLAEANELVEAYGAELSSDLRNFISASVRRATRRQRLVQFAAFAFAVIAVLAMFARFQAQKSEKSAEASYGAARGTIDDVIQKFAGGMKQADGIPLSTVKEALGAVKGLVGKLHEQNGNDPELVGTQAAMEYEFASVYYLATSGETFSPEAMAAAETGVNLWRGLVRDHPDRLDWQWKLALSLDQVGDFLRRAPSPKSVACGDAWHCYSEARTIRKALMAAQPDNLQFVCGRSLSGSRLGDLALRNKQTMTANFYYTDEFKAAKTLLKKKRAGSIPDCAWPRELFWSYNKLGAVETALKHPARAQDAYIKERCVHLQVIAHKPDDLLARADLAWNLDYRLAAVEASNSTGAAKNGANAPAEADYFAGLSIREDLHTKDEGRARWTSELADALHRVSAFEAGQDNLPLALALVNEEIKDRRLADSVPRRNAVASDSCKVPHKTPLSKSAASMLEAQCLERAIEAKLTPEEAAHIKDESHRTVAGQEHDAERVLDGYYSGTKSCWKALVAAPDVAGKS